MTEQAEQKYLTLKLTLEEIQLIGQALLKVPGGYQLMVIVGAQVEVQHENPHPDAVKIVEGRV